MSKAKKLPIFYFFCMRETTFFLKKMTISYKNWKVPISWEFLRLDMVSVSLIIFIFKRFSKSFFPQTSDPQSHQLRSKVRLEILFHILEKSPQVPKKIFPSSNQNNLLMQFWIFINWNIFEKGEKLQLKMIEIDDRSRDLVSRFFFLTSSALKKQKKNSRSSFVCSWLEDNLDGLWCKGEKLKIF
jgi:hypothetical protein